MTTLAIICLIAATAFDCVSTVIAKSRGATEANPILRLAGPLWIGARLALSAVICWLVWHYEAAVVGLVVAVAWAGVGFWNLHTARVAGAVSHVEHPRAGSNDM